MVQTKITFVVNGNTYSLTPDDLAGIKKIADEDRHALLLLLEEIKLCAGQSRMTAASSAPKQSSVIAPKSDVVLDPDLLMAKLMKEERRNYGGNPSTKTFYKCIAGFTCIVIILILVF